MAILYVASLVCDESCIWRALYVTSLVYDEPCLWRALYMASLFQIANREKNGFSVKCARNGSTSSDHQATTGSFVPTVNQARTRKVTSCHVMSHSNGENITVMPFNYYFCFNIMLYMTIIGTVLALQK